MDKITCKIKKKSTEKRHIEYADLKRIKIAMNEVRAVLLKYNFSPANRLYLYDNKTGKIYK